MRVVRSGVCNVWVSPVHPGLVSLLRLTSVLGGECDGMHILLKGHSHSICCTRMLIWSRALAIARAVSYRTFGGKTWSMSAVPLEHMTSL